jgi:hypothetical protein
MEYWVLSITPTSLCPPSPSPENQIIIRQTRELIVASVPLLEGA